MNTQVVLNRLKNYRLDSVAGELQAIREITQELILFALSTGDFFNYAAFQGGTCLRIIHGLNRFSEDMDFILRNPVPSFSWQPYLSLIGTTVGQYGYRIEVQDKSKTDSAIKKAFIKDDSIGKILDLAFAARQGSPQKIRIKLEIDTNPPGHGNFETKYLNFPSLSNISVQDKPTLFAGKSHALLCRKYEKGRDWYDFLWYAGTRTGINYNHLSAALDQSGPWAGKKIRVDQEWYTIQMTKRISEIDWQRAKDDVIDFLPVLEKRTLSLWGKDLFLSALDGLLPEVR